MSKQFGWVIVRGLPGEDHFWAGKVWSNESKDAVRFCRLEDAERFIVYAARRLPFDVKTVEHSWDEAPQSSS